MERSVDNRMSRLCGRLMSSAQIARDQIEYVLEEMEYIAESNPDREDVQSCLAEIKTKNKGGESENWATANKWSEHFDGIDAPTAENDDEAKEEDEQESTQKDTDAESDEQSSK